jgi:hypothetical protein
MTVWVYINPSKEVGDVDHLEGLCQLCVPRALSELMP